MAGSAPETVVVGVIVDRPSKERLRQTAIQGQIRKPDRMVDTGGILASIHQRRTSDEHPNANANEVVRMRSASPAYRPVVLTVAGSDAGGGAGIQADLKAIEAAGCFGASAITAVTAQNTVGVQEIEVLDPAMVTGQIEAVTDDLAVAAVKTGMLATESVIDAVTDSLESIDVPLVIDPVMVAASGDRLLDQAAEAAYDDLIEGASLVTPNADEAAVLTGVEIDDVEAAVEAGEALVDRGAQAALIKGGHWGSDRIEDVLVTEDAVETITHERIDSDATHGSGCFLASTIAARLARGEELSDAAATAIADAGRAIRYHLDIGEGPGSVHHLASLRTKAAVASTIETTEKLVSRLETADVGGLVPEVGMNVGVALPHAERTDEVAAIDGRLVRTGDAVARAGPVRMGGSGHVARYLLAVRELDPSYRAAANCRFTPAVETAMAELDWPTIEVDRADQPATVADQEGGTMQWVAETAYGGSGDPVAVYDRGAVGKEAMVRLIETSPTSLGDRMLELAGALDR